MFLKQNKGKESDVKQRIRLKKLTVWNLLKNFPSGLNAIKYVKMKLHVTGGKISVTEDERNWGLIGHTLDFTL